MENREKHKGTFVNSIEAQEADIKKARLVSSIVEKAEQGDEEENQGRS